MGAGLTLLLLWTPLGEGVEAQERSLQYTTQTRVEFGGVLGRALQDIPGLSGLQAESSETVYILGTRMRTDSGDQTTILDLDAGRFMSVHHDAGEVLLVELGDMEAFLSEMDEAFEDAIQEITPALDSARAEIAQAQAEMDRAQAELAESGESLSVDVQISTDRTGERRTIHGVEAERVFLTMELGAEVDSADDGPLEGSFVLFTELWNAPEVPGFEGFTELDQSVGETVAGSRFVGVLGALQEAITMDPRIQVGLERNQAELEALGGTTLLSTTHFVLVPGGQPFDRAAVLAEAERSLADDVLETAGERAREGAADAAREAVTGRLGGLFGGGDDEEEEEPEEEEERQGTVLRFVTEITEMETGPLSPDLFQAPEGYAERPFSIGLPTGDGGG